MSIPKELLDQLLTGYLDDALSADERARVEQMIQSNAEIAHDLDELHDLRLSLKAVAASASDIKLESGFADRVLGAAVARAQAEGLPDDHPLVRLAEQPSTRGTRGASNSSSWRVASVMIALAASIAIAVVTLRPEAPAIPEGPQLAAVETSPTIPAPDADPREIPDVTIEAAPTTASPEMVASAAPDVVRPTSPVGDDSVPGIDSPESNMDQLEATSRSPIEAVAASQIPAEAADTAHPTVEIDLPQSARDVPQSARGAILVLDVRRTDAGRQSGAVAEAMKLAAIAPASEKKITDEIAGFVNEAEQSENDDVSVLYMEASAKDLDRFYLRLLADQEGIESVGMSIAIDAPIMKVVSAIRPEPTEVIHNGTSLELLSDDGAVDDLARQLGQLQFLPMGRQVLKTKGPDEQAQILVLVR